MHISWLIYVFVDPTVFRSARASLTPSLLRARALRVLLRHDASNDLKFLATKTPFRLFLVLMVCREGKHRDKLFFSTCWPMVLKAGDSATTSAHALSALSQLCEVYWRPVYVFLRKRGYGRDDAQDLTQAFFAHLIQNRGYSHADPEKGRFRSFLLGALKHFIADARDRERALKRGGGIIVENLDGNVEAQIARGARWQADELYDREWAASLVRQALDRLAQECALAGKAELFSCLMPHLIMREEIAVAYAEMARRSHRAVSTLRHERARLRARYRAILRAEVRATVSDPTEVDEELRYLYRVLALACDGRRET
jgi:DNA-directed RNA polymerase specialized sigma24 family protein